MPTSDIMTHLPVVLHPDPSRVVIRPFIPAESPPAIVGGHGRRAQRIADRVLALSADEAQAILARVTASLAERHHDEDGRDLSQIVIFPVTQHQQHGIEDLRLVRCTDDDGNASYLGTYTAFSGQAIRQELLRTLDFRTFELSALRGDATANKGMALFPRRLDGRYAMLGRQDHENIWFLTSDDLYEWNGGTKIVSPRWSWEFVQMGNGGSPIEIDEGWLVITHGIGAVRTYCIGACLLDRDDPTKLLGRVVHPLVRPSAAQRYGYVPNVAYTCGAMVHGRILVLPFALADSFTAFATVHLDTLLAAMT